MKEAVCQCSENSREKYLDKIETADIIETVMMNQKRVYLYKESVEKTSRIVETGQRTASQEKPEITEAGGCGWKRRTGKQI
ncbi:MAG: hypothetical protein ACLTR6_16065 [Clostridium fessum]